MFCANISGPLNRGMVTRYTTTLLQEVFTRRNFVADFIQLKLNFIFKKQKVAFWATLWGLRGNLHTPFIARWKLRGRLSIRHNWTFFAVSYGRDVISGNLSKSACFEAGGSLWAQISDGRRHRPPTTVGASKLAWLPFRVVAKYLQCIVWFCHKACRRTELWQVIPR